MPGENGFLNSYQSGQLTTLGRYLFYNQKTSRTQTTVLSSGLFSYVFLFLPMCSFYNTAFFLVQPHLISVCLLVFLLSVSMCVWLFCFLFCWILVVLLSFQSSPPSAMVNQKMVFNPSKAQSLRPA